MKARRLHARAAKDLAWVEPSVRVDCFVVRGLKIIHSANRFFVAMPARRRSDGTFQDIAHPIHAQARRMIEERVLDEYEKTVAAEAT